MLSNLPHRQKESKTENRATTPVCVCVHLSKKKSANVTYELYEHGGTCEVSSRLFVGIMDPGGVEVQGAWNGARNRGGIKREQVTNQNGKATATV